MKARARVVSALAVIVSFGILGMHAAGFGHTAMTAMVDMVHEQPAHLGSPSMTALEAPEPAGDGHAGFLSTVCVAILSIALSLIAARVARRAHASSRLHLLPQTWSARPITRTRAGPPPPLLVPLRT